MKNKKILILGLVLLAGVTYVLINKNQPATTIAQDPELIGVWHAEHAYWQDPDNQWTEIGKGNPQISLMYVKFEKDRMCSQLESNPLKVDCSLSPVSYKMTSSRVLDFTVG